MSDLSALQEIALIVGPLAAAIAAIASLISVRQTRRIARDAELPDLAVQVTVDVDTGLINGTIHNAGGGVARGVTYVIAHAGKLATGWAHHGILRANEMAEVRTEIAAEKRTLTGEDFAAMVTARDRFGGGHAWTHKEDHRAYKTRFLRRPRYGGAVLPRFREFYPELDTDKLTQVKSGAVIGGAG